MLLLHTNMIDFFIRVWDDLVMRTEGPMHLRFFFQPATSLFFATRAAIGDAKSGIVPFLPRLIHAKGKRRAIVKEAWKDVGKIFIVGIVIDIIYQLIAIYKLKIEASFYPLESIIVAFILAFVPYLLFRGLIGRTIRLFMKR